MNGIEIKRYSEMAVTVSTEMQLIRDLATDDRVSVEKLAALMQLHERVESRDARKQFTAAFREASIEMPRIEKKGVIEMGAKGRMSFARYEDVDRIVRDVEIRHGFTRSFLSEPTETGILLTCVLSHAAGHSERSTRWMPPDPGPGRNGMQAPSAASLSQLKRALKSGRVLKASFCSCVVTMPLSAAMPAPHTSDTLASAGNGR